VKLFCLTNRKSGFQISDFIYGSLNLYMKYAFS